jgi:hypothetical protein
MRRIPLASLIVLAGLVRAAEVAPTNNPASPPRSGSSVEADKVGVVASPAPIVSTATSAKIAAAVPKFAPPAVEQAFPAVPAPLAPTADSARSAIVRLPNFIVGEPRFHVPTPLQVLTPKGRVEHAFQRRPGLRIVPAGGMNARIALEMLEDDLQAQRRRDAAELLSLHLIP